MDTPPPGTGTTAPPRAPWRFVRRERGRVIAGVSTGMADAFHIDVVVIRVLWVIAALAGGFGVAAYAICWVAFPSDRHAAPISHVSFHEREGRFRNAVVIVAIVLIGIGLASMFAAVWPPFRHGGEIAWATVLIIAGAAVLLFRSAEDDEPRPPGPPGTDAPVPPAGDTPASALLPIPPAAPVPPQPPTTSAWTQHAPWPAPPPKPPRVRRRRPRPFLTPLTLSALLIGAGIVALLDSTGSLHFTAAGVLASGLIVVGAALIVSAWYGRAHGLIPIGILLLLVTVPAAAIDVPISGGIGARRYHPTTRSELRSNYHLGIGHFDLDLRDAPLTGNVTRISASLGIGEFDVDVPADVRVDVRAHAGAGSTDVFGSVSGGWPQDSNQTVGVGEPGELSLDLRVGAGSVRVRRFTPDGSLITTLTGRT